MRINFYAPVFNLESSPGEAAKLGFVVGRVPVVIDGEVSPEPPYNVIGRLSNVSQARLLIGSELVLWGNPAGEEHDLYRGSCVALSDNEGDFPPDGAHNIRSLGSCSSDLDERAFLTLPGRCESPIFTEFEADSLAYPRHLGREISAVDGFESNRSKLTKLAATIDVAALLERLPEQELPPWQTRWLRISKQAKHRSNRERFRQRSNSTAMLSRAS